jgi:hypothetical protein
MHSLLIALAMEPVSTSEMSTDLSQTIQHSFPKDGHLQSKNFLILIIFIFVLPNTSHSQCLDNGFWILLVF